MESDLLRKEQEFHKINSELEERTSRLLKNLDSAKLKTELNTDGMGFRNSHIAYCSKSFSLKDDGNCSKSAGSKDNQAAGTLTKKEGGEDPLAIRSNGLGYEATNRLLRAKLTILNKEIGVLQQDYKSKSEECRKITADLARCEEDGARLEVSLSAAKENAANFQGKLEQALQQLSRVQAENASLHKEVNSLKKDLKLQKQQSSTTELRLNRALEDIERLKNAAKQTQFNMKEERETQRKTTDQLQLKIRSLDRQKTELMNVCTKQSHLIDNLRRQKVHLEVTRFAHAAEAEFDSILDWCLKQEIKEGKSKV